MSRSGVRSALLLLGLAAGTSGCSHESSDEVETEAAVPVTVAPVSRGDIRAVLAATGIVAAEPGADWTITAPLPGHVAAIAKVEGDPVRKGEVLVRFEVPSLAADAAGRRAEVEKARVSVATAQAALARTAGLVERGIAARKDAEEARRELADAEAQMAEAVASSAAAATLSGQAVVHARFDGVVARRWHNPGDLVEAASGDPVLRVIDPGRLQVAAAIPSTDLAAIEIGAPARVFPPGSREPEPARVASRPGAVDPATGSGEVRLGFAGPTRLVLGTAVGIEIDGAESKAVLLVPAEAVVREGEGASLLVLGDDGHAHRKEVEVGVVAAGKAEIRSGVAEGERVIVGGRAALPDDALVTVAR